MKVLSTAAVLLAGASSTSAFAPSASRAAATRSNNANCPSLQMNVPFFAQEETKKEESAPVEGGAVIDGPTGKTVDGFTDEELAIVFPQVDSYKESLLI